MSQNAIEVEGLRVMRGGKEVLHGISLSVRRGSVTGLLGPGGCGKTVPCFLLVLLRFVFDVRSRSFSR